MKKVVYNRCYGGFGLSPVAIKRYLELARPEITPTFYTEEWSGRFGVLYTKVKAEDIKKYDDFITLLKDYGDHPEETSYIGPCFYEIDDYFDYWSIKRSDPNLVKVVEELGEKANGRHASLAIKEVEGKYRVCEYDGSEWVETPESIKWEE